jgi:hypothetical protein
METLPPLPASAPREKDACTISIPRLRPKATRGYDFWGTTGVPSHHCTIPGRVVGYFLSNFCSERPPSTVMTCPVMASFSIIATVM